MRHTIADVQKVNPEFRLDHNRVKHAYLIHKHKGYSVHN